MSDYWEEEYLGISPYQGEMEALVTAIRESAEKEVQEEISQLREENKKLQGIKKHFEEVKRDYERKKAECDRIAAHAEYNARTARLNELMKDRKLVRWRISSRLAYGAKCNKCSDWRKIKVTLPSGNVADDRCMCDTGMRNMYFPVSCALYEIADWEGIVGWYKECTYSDTRKSYILSGEYGAVYDANNEKNIEKLKRHEEEGIRNALFDSREECQKVCDELNAEEGHPDWIYTMEGKKIVGEENG